MPKLFIKLDSLKESHCPICKNDSVRLYGRYNTVNYPAILNKIYSGIIPREEIRKRLDTYEIIKMVCDSCGTEYIVDNRYDLPRVLYPGCADYMYFMSMWKNRGC